MGAAVICERGRVVAADDNALWVETIQQSSCSSCAAKKGCGQGLMNSLHDGRRNQIRVALDGQSAGDYPIGSDVDIAIPESALLGGAFVVYLLPLLSMLGIMALVAQRYDSDGLAALGAVLGFLLGLMAVRLHAWTSRNNPRFQPRVIGLHKAVASDVMTFVDPR